MTSPRAEEISSDADAALGSLLALADRHPEADLAEAWKFRRVADVLAHLHAWHVLFVGWVAQARAGAEPAFPAEGYTWAALDELNDTLYEQHRHDGFPELRSSLITSHRLMLETLADCTQDELTSPGAFAWLGDATLGDVAHECLGAHYDWVLISALVLN